MILHPRLGFHDWKFTNKEYSAYEILTKEPKLVFKSLVESEGVVVNVIDKMVIGNATQHAEY